MKNDTKRAIRHVARALELTQQNDYGFGSLFDLVQTLIRRKNPGENPSKNPDLNLVNVGTKTCMACVDGNRVRPGQIMTYNNMYKAKADANTLYQRLFQTQPDTEINKQFAESERILWTQNEQYTAVVVNKFTPVIVSKSPTEYYRVHMISVPAKGNVNTGMYVDQDAMIEDIFPKWYNQDTYNINDEYEMKVTEEKKKVERHIYIIPKYEVLDADARERAISYIGTNLTKNYNGSKTPDIVEELRAAQFCDPQPFVIVHKTTVMGISWHSLEKNSTKAAITDESAAATTSEETIKRLEGEQARKKKILEEEIKRCERHIMQVKNNLNIQ